MFQIFYFALNGFFPLLFFSTSVKALVEVKPIRKTCRRTRGERRSGGGGGGGGATAALDEWAAVHSFSLIHCGSVGC